VTRGRGRGLSYSIVTARKRRPPTTAPTTLKKGLRMTLAPDRSIQDSPPNTSYGFHIAGRPTCCVAEEAGPFVPYHSEDEPPVLCWDCHGYLVGPPGRRLCHCQKPGTVSPAETEKFRALEAIRDALAEAYRRRWFRVLMPLLDAEDEARAAWDALLCAARKRAACRLAEPPVQTTRTAARANRKAGRLLEGGRFKEHPA